ncbi:MAG TPA: hydroxymethylglutaryl-CoA lyase [Mucilaginibacter sp.]|nr:hydroxymethylglutaryl-CoA lyase [Mucilaginibacter sp.]
MSLWLISISRQQRQIELKTPEIKITECPRDAMQGMHQFIPTDQKTEYINKLLEVGFDTIDFGSFVSVRAIPQMRDTKEVLGKLKLAESRSKLLAIVANYRGAAEAAEYPEISYLGYPFSISETFQQRNANTSINDAFETVKQMADLCGSNSKELLIYLSMGFGNPYGDKWNEEIVLEWTQRLTAIGVKTIAIADTIGMATAQQISELYPVLRRSFPGTEFGIHLHSTPDKYYEKIDAAFRAGCRRFDSAIKGFGGCPMAEDKLTGNIATEDLIGYFQSQGIVTGLDMGKFREAMLYAETIFAGIH